MADNAFSRAFAEWMRARATIAETNANDELPDEDTTAANDTLSKAEWKLIETPIDLPRQLSDRAKFVQHMFIEAETAGEPPDNRHRVAMEVLIAEIDRFILLPV